MVDLINSLYKRIGRPLNLMEVCGTHTVAIFRNGIRSVLPKGLTLLSGPGCPVCVTSIMDVDKSIALARRSDVILTTFGDMLRVPGGSGSLMDARSEGADIRIVYSPLDSLKIASENPDRKVVFFGAGFETTSPLSAATVLAADAQGIANFYLFSVHKTVPPAIEALLASGEVKIDGFILPGHVSTIIGTIPYKFIADKFGIPCAVAGFGAEDILGGIAMLLRQVHEGKPRIDVEYTTVVKEAGNPKAVAILESVFEPSDSYWRGIGNIPGSGLKLRDSYSHRDIEKVVSLQVPEVQEPAGCMCGQVLKGMQMPHDCPLFGTACTPETPVGACMVSTEGSCAAYYKYRDVLQ